MTGQPEGCKHKAGFLPLSEQGALLQELMGFLYEHELFRGRLMKRAWAQFGYSYVAAAHKVTRPPAMPGVPPDGPTKRKRLLSRRSHVNPGMRHYYDWKGVIKSGRGRAYNLLILKALILPIMGDGETTEKRRRDDGKTTSK